MPRLWPALTALFLVACAGDERDAAIAERDSAGIGIVEHAPGAVEQVAVWTVAPEPLLDLGVVDGDPAYQFFRIGGGLRLDDGRIVVVNGGTAELRVFGPDGAHLQTVGGKGSGPGEFQLPWDIWRAPGDSIAVYDWEGQSVSLFSHDLAFGRVARFSPAFLNPPSFVGAYSNGDVLLYDPVFDIPEAGFDTIWAYARRYGIDGREVDTVGRYSMGIMGRYGDLGVVGGPAFQTRTILAVADDRVVVGPGDSYRLVYLDSAGAPRRIVRWHDADRAVTAADLEAYRQSRLAAARDDNARRREETRLAAQPVPETFAAYDALTADRTGSVWARAAVRPSRSGPARYTIFAEGRLIARAELPRDLRVLDIGADHVLGVVRDELDVEHVIVYRLSRGPR